MRSILVAVATLVGCGSTTPAPTAPTAPTAPPLATAIATAGQANQPLVVEFGATWCKPCRQIATMLAEVRVKTALTAVTFVQYDIETPVGADAARRCHVTGVPAIVSLDRAGGVVKTLSAVPTADDFVAFLRATHP